MYPGCVEEVGRTREAEEERKTLTEAQSKPMMAAAVGSIIPLFTSVLSGGKGLIPLPSPSSSEK